MTADTLSAVTKSSNVLQLYCGLQRAAAELHFPLVTFALRVTTEQGPEHFSLSNYPDAWRTQYNERNYIATDPVLRQSLLSLSALFWDELPLDNQDDVSFMREAASHGIRHGITLPLYGEHGEIGILSLARATPLPGDIEDREKIRVAGTGLAWAGFDAAMRLLGPDARHLSLLHLTEQEVRCLKRAALGEPDPTAIERESTRAFLIMSAVRKLGVSTRQEARSAAGALGLLLDSANEDTSAPSGAHRLH